MGKQLFVVPPKVECQRDTKEWGADEIFGVLSFAGLGAGGERLEPIASSLAVGQEPGNEGLSAHMYLSRIETGVRTGTQVEPWAAPVVITYPDELLAVSIGMQLWEHDKGDAYAALMGITPDMPPTVLDQVVNAADPIVRDALTSAAGGLGAIVGIGIDFVRALVQDMGKDDLLGVRTTTLLTESDLGLSVVQDAYEFRKFRGQYRILLDARLRDVELAG